MKAAGEVLTAKQAPHRPGTAPALGLRAGEVAVAMIPGMKKATAEMIGTAGLLPGISMASLPSTKTLLALPKRFLDLPKASLSPGRPRGVRRVRWRLPLGAGDVPSAPSNEFTQRVEDGSRPPNAQD